ncbi:MAG: hypothetical protein JSS11_07680 [Verrucomicrobia bacterium]|nr:hypothetical protein [Verrucomicrobiota bacterium]
MEKSTFRSIAAVVAGVLAIAFVTKIVDVVLMAMGVYSGTKMDDHMALVASSHRFFFTIAGGWLTARLAPGKPVMHAVILGAVAAVLVLPGVFTTWNSDYAPRWYLLSLAVLAIPECWLGGTLFVRSRRAEAPKA